jgi:hypothetical protein
VGWHYLTAKSRQQLTGTGVVMDLFGKKTRQELEQLQQDMSALTLRLNHGVKRYNTTFEELQKSTAMIATINAGNKSEALYQSAKLRHDQKFDEYCKLFKELTEKETVLLSTHDKKKTSLIKEMGDLEEKDRAIKAELSDSQKRAKTLAKEIQASENKRDSVAAEIEQLKADRVNIETALSKAQGQGQQSELSSAVDKLTRQQDVLSKSNLYLNQVVSHLNRYGDEDTVFASLEHDLHRFLADDRSSGAMQLELKARPLLLVVDIGSDSLNFAAVRAGLVSGNSEISLQFESRKVVQGMGCCRFEALLAGWVWERISAIHPLLKGSVKDQNGVEHCLPVARRLLALLCHGAPQGEMEETIVIDSEPFSASIPLQREELVSVFLPLLGPDGELTEAIRLFLTEYKLSVNVIDRIVCMGWSGRLPMLRESLEEVIKRPVLSSSLLPTVGLEHLKTTTEENKEANELPKANVLIVNTESREDMEERKRREKKMQERKKLESGFTCPLTGMEFVFVRGDTFQMGDTFGDGKDNEMPVKDLVGTNDAEFSCKD